jgi:formate dehydrogenase subunit gamma
MIIYYVRYNFPEKGDLKFLLTAGGLLSKKHLENNYFNAGEKILFWSTIILGVILSATGLLLLFPYYENTVVWTQVALVIHAIAALLLIALTFGHIWMVVSVEGTFDAMVDGKVDENWAKAHHSIWYKKITNNPESNQSGALIEDQEDGIPNNISSVEQEGAH